ncbi:hypothetical protein KCP73_11275 [Salmonella enterica subsp. enterica]|nr:hypothetical protein KCP73_11275 [Salmonella enterica subsp. enterica]
MIRLYCHHRTLMMHWNRFDKQTMMIHRTKHHQATCPTTPTRGAGRHLPGVCDLPVEGGCYKLVSLEGLAPLCGAI